MQNNALRLPATPYLLHCLLAARQAGCGEAHAIPHRADGEPAKPSRLLFRLHGCGASFACDKHLQSGRLAARRTRERGLTPLRFRNDRPHLAAGDAFGDYLRISFEILL
jgi:hypothetical protein